MAEVVVALITTQPSGSWVQILDLTEAKNRLFLPCDSSLLPAGCDPTDSAASVAVSAERFRNSR
jgi:hypothetical protein